MPDGRVAFSIGRGNADRELNIDRFVDVSGEECSRDVEPVEVEIALSCQCEE